MAAVVIIPIAINLALAAGQNSSTESRRRTRASSQRRQSIAASFAADPEDRG